jgi:hypothetical protein
MEKHTMEKYKMESNKFVCILCNKKYTKKSSFENHRILCDYRLKSKREKLIESEESQDMPTYNELVKIVNLLSCKFVKMEEKIEKLQKAAYTKGKKIDILNWLNINNITPDLDFMSWVDIKFIISKHHLEYLMEDNIYKTVQTIFEDAFNDPNFTYPIKCFTQKVGIFYIYEQQDDSNETTLIWKKMELKHMIALLGKIQKNLISYLLSWKNENKSKFDDDDDTRLLEKFNKISTKLMDISFKQDATLTKMQNNLYNYLKKEFVQFDIID